MTRREMDQAIRHLRREGFNTEITPGGHWKITRSDMSAPVYAATSPSCRYAVRNLLATIRRCLPTPNH